MADESWLDDLLGYKTVIGPPVADEPFHEHPRRSRLSFQGDAVTVLDDPTTDTTTVTIAAGGGGGGDVGPGNVLPAARVATVAPHILSGLDDVDGISINDGDRILVRSQVDPAENGVYVARAVAWERTEDVLAGMAMIGVNLGSAGDTVWMLTSDDIVLGVSPLVWQKVGSGDAESLRGVELDLTVGTPQNFQVLAFDGTKYAPRLLNDVSIEDDAGIAVSKLAPAVSNGQVLRTVAGVVGWSAITSGDLSETVIEASPIATSQNNYSPAGWATATMVRVSASAPGLAINGFGSASVKRKTILNIGAQPLTLTHNAGGQSAGNKIYTNSPFSANVVLGLGESVVVVYDSNDAVWRVLGNAGSLMYPAPLTRTVLVELDAQPGWRVSNAGTIIKTTTFSYYRKMFTLPTGAVLKRVRVGYRAGVQSGLGGPGAKIVVFGYTVDKTAPFADVAAAANALSTPAEYLASVSNNHHVYDTDAVAPLAFACDRATKACGVWIEAGDSLDDPGGGPEGLDFIEVTYTELGPGSA